jgi:hypothetical protein
MKNIKLLTRPIKSYANSASLNSFFVDGIAVNLPFQQLLGEIVTEMNNSPHCPL